VRIALVSPATEFDHRDHNDACALPAEARQVPDDQQEETANTRV